MKLDSIVTGVKLYCRRVLNTSGRNIKPGQEFLYQELAVPWRMVLRLYEQRRVVSENDPYFQELMETGGKVNNPEFAEAWLKSNGVKEIKKEPAPKKPKKSKRMTGPQKRAAEEKKEAKAASKKDEADRKEAGDLAAGIEPKKKKSTRKKGAKK